MLVTDVPAFRSFWYPVAFAEDLADGPLARRLLGEELVVWANGDGGASAALDRCPHRASRLSTGWVDDGCVVCPYHGWQYGADGRAVHIPQLDPGLPIPPKARLAVAHCAVRHGVVWIALDDPVLDIPDIPGIGQPGYRFVRQFDEVWACAAPRLMDNSFDPAHVAYVHQGSFGSPENARIDVPVVERTARGLRMRTSIEVENHLAEAQRSSGVTTARTVRTTESEFVAPFLRIMSITYPNGRHHVLATAATPVDDGHLRLVQFAVRNDTEQDTPAADVVAFDRLVTLEDQTLLENTKPDYELAATDNVHIKVDRGTLELRRVYREIVDGTWAPLLARTAPA
jgi:phenylpropionate dioxygenase-like ring-hydroxylating dioxygenase large terminal subunit